MRVYEGLPGWKWNVEWNGALRGDWAFVLVMGYRDLPWFTCAAEMTGVAVGRWGGGAGEVGEGTSGMGCLASAAPIATVALTVRHWKY